MIWIVSEITFINSEATEYYGKVVGIFDNKDEAFSYMRKRTDDKDKAHYIQGWEINETID